jgi:hypothetical protein
MGEWVKRLKGKKISKLKADSPRWRSGRLIAFNNIFSVCPEGFRDG